MRTKGDWKISAKRSAMIVLGICCIAALVGCGGDDGGDDTSQPESLAGTTWTEDQGTYSIEFDDNGNDFRMAISVGVEALGNYTQTGNTFTFTGSYHAGIGRIYDISLNGSFSGNSMSVHIVRREHAVNGQVVENRTALFTKQ